MGHDHGKDVDWNAMGAVIERRAAVYAPLYAQIIEAVLAQRPEPGLIVDAGSGPGAISCALAQAFPRAEVLAVDSAPALLEHARQRAADAGLSARVRTQLGELPGAFADLPAADVVWLGQSLHHVGDQRAALAAAAGALAPGGLLVLLEGGLHAQWLPRDIGFGTPGLLPRLTAAGETWFTAMRESLPGSTREVEHWPSLLSAAGLRHTSTRSFLLDLPAPVSPETREHVIASLERQRDVGAEYLTEDDAATVDRLLDPDDAASLQHRPDVFLLDVQTVHFAAKAEL